MKIVNKFKFIRSITILVFFLIALFNISIAKSNDQEIMEYTINKGETLWSIAEEYKTDNEDIRKYIFDIKQLNNMTDSTVYEGQKIQIKKGQ